MNSHKEGLLSVHLAVMLFGLTALFSKLIDLSAVDITFIRSIFAVIAITLYIKFLKESLWLNRPIDYVISIGLGLLLCGHWVTYFHSMQLSSVAVGIIALNTYPIMTVFLEPLINKERLFVKDVASAIVMLIGVYFLVPEFSIDNKITEGVLWGVLSAFLFALRNVLHGKYFKAYPARHALLYQTLIIVFVLLFFSVDVVSTITAQQWLMLILLGVFFTALPHTLFANSLRHLKAKTVSLIGCLIVAYGVVFAALILEEVPSWRTIMGGALVVSAAIFETISIVKNNKIQKPQ